MNWLKQYEENGEHALVDHLMRFAQSVQVPMGPLGLQPVKAPVPAAQSQYVQQLAPGQAYKARVVKAQDGKLYELDDKEVLDVRLPSLGLQLVGYLV